MPMHQVISGPRLLPFFADRSLRKNMNMVIVFVLLNMDPLLHLYFLLLVDWARKLLFFTII